MKKQFYYLTLLLVAMPLLLHAQEDDKYLAGAVPEVDGKVVFTKVFDLTGASQDQIYDRVYSWLDARMKQNENNSRIAYSDKAKGVIAATGHEYIVFKSSALSLDRTEVNYQITVACEPGKCTIELERIRYEYSEDKYNAEEQITDKVALNKSKTKLVRGLAKFRTKTVDFADEMFDGARAAFGLPAVTPVVAQPPVVTPIVPVAAAPVAAQPEPTVIPAATLTPAMPVAAATTSATTGDDLAGYRRLSPDKIPGNIINMLNEDWMLITAGNDQKFNMMTASWGGLGMLYQKPIAICFINPTRYTYQLMETNDTYTLTFYTEAYRDALKYNGSNSGRTTDKVKGSGLTPITTPAGSKAFAEAWLVIECRKMVSQSFMHESIADEKIKEEWMGKQMHKMYIGEIINVWVK